MVSLKREKQMTAHHTQQSHLNGPTRPICVSDVLSEEAGEGED